jgi:hypothetical protein
MGVQLAGHYSSPHARAAPALNSPPFSPSLQFRSLAHYTRLIQELTTMRTTSVLDSEKCPPIRPTQAAAGGSIAGGRQPRAAAVAATAAVANGLAAQDYSFSFGGDEQVSNPNPNPNPNPMTHTLVTHHPSPSPRRLHPLPSSCRSGATSVAR